MKYMVEVRKQGAIGVFTTRYIEADSKIEAIEKAHSLGFETGVIVTVEDIIRLLEKRR